MEGIMSLRARLSSKIKLKEQEIQELEWKIREARAYMQALQDAIKLAPKDLNDKNGTQDHGLRPGSEIAKARDYLRSHGKPLHISEILVGIGKENSKPNRLALSGSIARYVRQGVIFSRPGPNIFGLLEFPDTPKQQELDQPPDDFGLN
jgi:hypothetical protein